MTESPPLLRPLALTLVGCVAATIVGCAAPHEASESNASDIPRQLLEQRHYGRAFDAQAKAQAAGLTQGLGGLPVLMERIRVECRARGPDLDDPKLCEQLAAAGVRMPTPGGRKTEHALSATSGPSGATMPSSDTGPVLSARPAELAHVTAPPNALTPAGRWSKDSALLQRKVNLEFNQAALRSVISVIAIATDLDIVFDRDMPSDVRLSLHLRDTTAESALDKVALAAGLAWRMLDARTLMIYPDQGNKQADYQVLSVHSYFLEHADARTVAASLKTLLKVRDLVIDDKLNMLVLRDTPEVQRQAEQILRMQDVPEPEVLLDVQVIEVKRSLLQQLGIQWPAQISLQPLALQRQGPSGVYDAAVPLTLRDLGNGTAGVGLSISPLVLNARRESGDVNLLASPRLRAKNRERSRIMIGERVPNVSTTTTATGLVAESVNYVDVGLRLEVQPQVFAGDEVLVRLDLEVSNILEATQSRSGSIAYRIGTRNANTALRLRDGENQLLAGLIQDGDQRGDASVPGLRNLPLLGRLFGGQRGESSKTEIVLSITPHLIRPIAGGTRSDRRFDGGTASGLRGRAGGESSSPATATDSTAMPFSGAGSTPSALTVSTTPRLELAAPPLLPTAGPASAR